MIKNPQIKFQSHSPKEYLFPKHSGKFLMQAKLRQIKALKNYMPHKVHKETKIYNDLYKDDYKQMKAQADYIKRIQELKKKLEKQIKRYNQEKKSNEDLVRNLSLGIDHKSSIIKLQEFCVNMRYEKGREQSGNPEHKQSKSMDKKRYPKSFQPISYHMRNKTQMKRKSRTQESQMFQLKHYSYLRNPPQYFSNRTERLSNSELIKLPPVERRQNSLEARYSLHNQSQNRLYLLSPIDKLSLSVNMNSHHLAQKQSQLINDNSPRHQGQPRVNRMFMFSLSQKYASRNQKKKLLELSQKPYDSENFLKGWEIAPDIKGFNDNDSIC